ncbi:CBS domain-containing protein [Azoarcus indigens]|uniref:IMP dehydrogenase n=1 Tax=Azoarcus indigens TaxID=29545 RepID=A0A4R6EF70_9RHOO|nr:CBS domain-containing protein [Azoarcus indigens]NMG65933.1 CBS domain-containing protein [Azoarcus indigens]TDN55918.1 IMP dehydrogenase [Azoarcus indigens]
MLVREAMTRDVKLVNPSQSIHEAARMMADCDVGSLPVGENGRLVGMVTDRDIAIRGVAAGMAGETEVRKVMSEQVKYCFDDDELDGVARNMGDIQLHRLVVLDHDKKMVGIISLADLANRQGERPAGQAVCGISQPSHSPGSSASPPAGRNSGGPGSSTQMS